MTDSPTAGVSRRQMLLGVKLRALVGDHVGASVEAEPHGILNGSALLHGNAAWVLIDGEASRSFGNALAWAVRHRATSLDVIAESGGGVIARRAERFSLPVRVWFAEQRTLLPTVAEPLAARPTAREDHGDLTRMIVDAGAVPNSEHGVVFGEVRGLEVCRIVDQPTVGFFAEPGDITLLPSVAAANSSAEGDLRLEVGVGAADREAFQMLHGNIPTAEALASVVDAVIAHRSVDALQHPLNRLGRERFLRWQAEQDPRTVGLVDLVPAEPPVPRPNLKDPVPCVARGHDAAGKPVNVVFSSGVDLDLVPFVADVQVVNDARVVVVLPGRDLVKVTQEIADLLIAPIEFISLD